MKRVANPWEHFRPYQISSLPEAAAGAFLAVYDGGKSKSNKVMCLSLEELLVDKVPGNRP